MPSSATVPESIRPLEAPARLTGRRRSAGAPTGKALAGKAPTGKLPARRLHALFGAGMAACDTLVIVGAALLSGLVYARGGTSWGCLLLGAAAAAFFVVPSLARGDYALGRFLSFKGHARRGLTPWCVAVLGALVLAFLTKSSGALSRGTVLVLFVTGFSGLMALRAALVPVLAARMRIRALAARRIVLVGDEAMIRDFTARRDPSEAGLRLLGASVLRAAPECLADDLALAAASARVLRPDDVFILVPWADRHRLDACVAAFMRLPVSIHLAPERFLERFEDLRVARAGAIASLRLVKGPLTASEVALKRIVDIAVAGAALICLAPVLLAVAAAIKIDSPGPVMFRQRRYGFNQEPFRILKFRSMRALEDDRRLRQATRDDPRITAVGRFIRRTNIDELPQLFNVLKGDMSLVGPRPHALAHDQAFERDIALYARRHNVRPGITGWAQVNGWRGETDTPDKIRGRVEHDLHYIDHWSPLLDASILFRTAFSRKAYRNAR